MIRNMFDSVIDPQEYQDFDESIADILDDDGNLIEDHMKDPYCKRYYLCHLKAKKYDLHDLVSITRDLICSLHSGNTKALGGSYMFLRGGKVPPLNLEEIKSFLYTYCEKMEQAMQAFTDRKKALKFSKKDDVCVFVVSALGSKSNFDMGHDTQQMMESQRAAMRKTHEGAVADLFRDFLAESPIDKYERKEETGYEDSVKHAAQITDAETANECGKQAFKEGKNWTAELYWKRATELGRSAKYYSNLAYVRIIQGRFLRSFHLGYRESATEMLEQAVNDAQAAIELDPTFHRAYQRWAEALLALGPYDRATEAYRVIMKAKEAIADAEPSKPLIELEDMAKTNARRWLPVQARLSSDTATIPQMIHAALANLRSCVVASLAIDDPLMTDEEMKKAAEKIVDAAWAARGAIQLTYMRQAQWAREKGIANGKEQVSDIIEAEKQLRGVSKLIPLRFVELCESLKQVAFMEDPWMLWGLDRLDRKCVYYLSPLAKDPCEGDRIDDAELQEGMLRLGSTASMGFSDMVTALESIRGKGPRSFDQDLTPNRLAAFTCGVLERIILSKDSVLSQDASKRLIQMYFMANRNGLWAGGEFIGMCMNAASGLGKYGLQPDPARTKAFMSLTGGVAALAKEIGASNDDNNVYQKAISTLSPEDWALKDTFDIANVLREYICYGLDEHHFLNPADIAPFCATILSAMLDGVPETLEMFRTGKSPAAGSDQYSRYSVITTLLNKSAFGVFLTRRFEHYEDYLKGHRGNVTTKGVVSLVIRKWLKADKDKRSAYRWESYDDQIKEELARLAPVDRAEYMTQEEEITDDLLRKPIPKAPECAYCGKKEGGGAVLLTCPCRAAKYCDGDCQKADRPKHRAVCKKLLSGKKK